MIHFSFKKYVLTTVCFVSFYFLFSVFIIGAEPACTGSCLDSTTCGDRGGTVVAGKCASGVCCKLPAVVSCTCGGANGGTYQTPPTTSFCSEGSMNSFSGVGPWSWDCIPVSGECNKKKSCSALYDNTPVDYCESLGAICYASRDSCLNGAEGTPVYKESTIITDAVAQYQCVNKGYSTSAVCCKHVCSNRIKGTCIFPSRCLNQTSGDPCPEGELCCLLDIPDSECTTNAECSYLTCGKCITIAQTSTSAAYNKCDSVYTKGTDGACGGSRGGSFCDAPTTGLCGPGSLNTFWNGGFSWNCMGERGDCQTRGNTSGTCTATDLPTVDGQCYAINDHGCSAGTVSDSGATTTKSDGIYSLWNCNGSCTGSNASCEYKLCNRVDGKCHPTNDNSCSAGTVSDVGATSVKSDGIYSLWNCNGSCTGSNASCEYKLCNRVDGVCGSPADGCFPPTANFCLTAYGNSAITTNANTFSWKCNGTCSGVQSPTCASTRLIINGKCGTSGDGIGDDNFTSTPAINLCSVGIASAVSLNGTTYSWTCNRNCNGTIANCIAVYDTAPNFSTAVLKNTSGTVIAVEAGGRNHSCDAAFAGSKTSLWTITASDANGAADIKEISLRFRSADTYSIGPTTPVNGIFTFTVDTTNFVAGTYHVEVLIDDQHSPDPPNRGWLDTGRDFYIWDCQVTVDGTIYDNSANLACVNGSNQGFSNPIPADIQTFTLAYGDKTPGGSTRNMTVVSPKFYSPQTLTWQNQYFLDTINTTNISFLGLFNRSKINDICVFYDDYLYPKVHVDAYSALPRIDIKYSAVMDQKAWFRVRDGGVLAKIMVENSVPVTCVTDCKTAVNGLVWSDNVNLTDSDENLTSEVQPLPPFGDYYEDLKYDINGGLNVGTTIAGSVSWSGVGSTRGVIFVGGDLTIDQNMVLGANDYVIFIVKGRIIIANTVTQVNGAFYTDTTIEVMGKNDTQLKILGSLYGRSGVNLSRSYVTKRKNNTAPAVEVTYDPNLIFRLPKKLWELYENWTLE